jgi:hypothetical protein
MITSFAVGAAPVASFGDKSAVAVASFGDKSAVAVAPAAGWASAGGAPRPRLPPGYQASRICPSVVTVAWARPQAALTMWATLHHPTDLDKVAS